MCVVGCVYLFARLYVYFSVCLFVVLWIRVCVYVRVDVCVCLYVWLIGSLGWLFVVCVVDLCMCVCLVACLCVRPVVHEFVVVLC